MDLAVVGVGAAVGLLVGMTSVGGGALLTPALVLGLGVSPAVAVGSDLLVASGMKLVGSAVYVRRCAVHWRTVGLLACGSLPGAVLGSFLLNLLAAERVDAFVLRVLGFVLILAGGAILLQEAYARMTARHPTDDRAAPPDWRPGAWTTALTPVLGLLIGFLVSVTSIGGGSLLLAALLVLYPLPARTTVGSDFVHAFLLTLAATPGHLVGGRVNGALVASLALGALPGVLCGARLTAVIPERPLRIALGTVLVGIGVFLSSQNPGNS